MHTCHANGCHEEAHPEMPFCKRHHQMLPEPHREKIWKGRRRGLCGACVPLDDPADPTSPKRAPDWNYYLNLGIAILACAEAPRYSPLPEWVDAQGFCWKGGIHDAEKTVRLAGKVIEKFNILPF